MTDSEVLKAQCLLCNPGLAVRAEESPGGLMLPSEYFRVLEFANGFLLRDNLLRFHGLESLAGCPSIQEWNAAKWKDEFGELARDIVFFASDIFGDQYGFATRDGRHQLCRFRCEGGHTEFIGGRDLMKWLRDHVLRDLSSLIDVGLASALMKRLGPIPLGHDIAFKLPLICGGKYEAENCEIMETSFHLQLLGQLSVQNRQHPHGTNIRRFDA